MRHTKKNLAKASSLRHFLVATTFLFSFSQAFASGAKMPNVAKDSTVSGPAISEPTAHEPAPQAPTAPPANVPTVENSSSTSTAANSAYAHLDPDHEVPSALLNKAINYFDTHKAKIRNQNQIAVIDFSQHSSKERFYIIDMSSGRVDRYQVAHGKNSDPDYDGYATKFSNQPGSEMSSQGFYLTAETYEGAHGYSLKLDGLSTTNSNVRSREIVIHPANYVQPGAKAGRSWGCPAVDPRYSVEIIDRIKGGTLIYAQ
ncbi:MAG: murein L,D-transpeptidase catalytic domain family protein [Bacteriovorax sp.]